MLNTKKTDFKIILNSNDTATWTGASKFNATYFLDLKQKLHKDDLFDKSYKMTFSLLSTSNAAISNANVYNIALNFSNGSNLYAVHQPTGTLTNTTALLSVCYDVPTTANFFNTQDTDNAPTFISDLRNIQSINLKLMNHAYALFNTEAVNYICVLHFQEI